MKAEIIITRFALLDSERKALGFEEDENYVLSWKDSNGGRWLKSNGSPVQDDEKTDLLNKWANEWEW
jgi:hypothetical protein